MDTRSADSPLRLVEDEIPAEVETDWNGPDSLDQFLSAIGRYPLLSPAQEVQLAKRIERGDERARSAMIESNLRLVVAIAKDHRNRGLPFLDLIQEGVLGLIRAVDRFDWRLGNRFATYAGWWIKHSIHAAVVDRGRSIRLPAPVVATMRRVELEERALTARLSRPPRNAELAASAGLTERQLESIRLAAASTATVSLDAHEPADAPDPTDDFDLADGAFAGALAELPDRDRRVLELRYGLGGGDPRSVSEIARELGVTVARVRQLEARALFALENRADIQELRGTVA